MEDKQKVYIKGNSTRGDEVIKLLKDLGGRNTQPVLELKDDAYYFINPEGVIDFAYTSGSAIWPFIKEFYKEVKLPRWKPEYRESYYFLDSNGIIVEAVWHCKQNDISRYEFGNCFKCIEEAKVARDKFKEMLNQ